MEKTKRTPRAKGSKTLNDKIVSAYHDHLLTEGKRPVSVYKFCIDIGVKEEEFYNVYGSFDGLDQSLWDEVAKRTIARLNNDESYLAFSAREKVLAFYFTLTEELKSNRSFFLYYLQAPPQLEIVPRYLKSFRLTFEKYILSVVEEGKTGGEIASRPMFEKQYPHLFWLHLGFILHFWKDDTTPGFEGTDAAIEKSVNLAFDLIGKGALDSVIDFGKFLYQNRR